jgi:hypothetical protein
MLVMPANAGIHAFEWRLGLHFVASKALLNRLRAGLKVMKVASFGL